EEPAPEEPVPEEPVPEEPVPEEPVPEEPVPEQSTLSADLRHAFPDTTAEVVTAVAIEPDAAFDSRLDSDDDTEPAPGDEAQDPAPLPSALDALPATRKPNVWFTSLIVGALLSVLVVQLGLVYRKELVEALPASRPFVATLCANLGCSMALPRDARAIRIEASDLNRLAPERDVFVLSATLSNAASNAQAYPHLELTLTNARDKAVVRRVFAPDEWLPAPPAETGFAARSAVTVEVNFSAEDVGAAGYRLYAFYP
ncbi:MAG: DUF3426 domain-containing protein, partial [Rhodocyclaceae bacterium]|nr:DUF3426 domain-containing protein [Rhodocyclaceae bacterium]